MQGVHFQVWWNSADLELIYMLKFEFPVILLLKIVKSQILKRHILNVFRFCDAKVFKTKKTLDLGNDEFFFAA